MKLPHPDISSWNKVYLAIDLKSFYASVECIQRNLDPLFTNLVVADAARTNKTICLAVSPALKQWGVPGRPRLFEVEQIIKQHNAKRHTQFSRAKSYDNRIIQQNYHTKIDYLIAPPQMKKYLTISSQIYHIYTQFVAPEDIHIYSIDEVFMDITPYLTKISAHELAEQLITAVKQATGITATVGIGENLYLAKVAMDIVAKRLPAMNNGMRLADLSVKAYRKYLWAHQPLTDFWRIGRGTARKLAQLNLNTMGAIAEFSTKPTQALQLYQLFGKNAELLIDHAWGNEPVTLAQIKHYRPKENSITNGQVLMRPYAKAEARTVLLEMVEDLALKLTAKQLVSAKLSVSFDYDVTNLTTHPTWAATTSDHYGRIVPRPTHGTVNLPYATNTASVMKKAAERFFHAHVFPELTIRKITVVACGVTPKEQATEQLDLFTQPTTTTKPPQAEHKRQEVILTLRQRFGKNAVIKALDLLPEATQTARNRQIGGHHD